LVVGGVILGEAAVEEGLQAVQSQWVLGSAARGSLSRSEVVVSAGEIAFPRVLRARALIALSPEALKRHLGLLAPGTLVIVDSDRVPEPADLDPGMDVRSLPILREAESLGLGRSVNVLALGVLVGLTGVVRPGSVRTVLARRFGDKAGPNLRAFRAGMELAAGSSSPPSSSGQARP